MKGMQGRLPLLLGLVFLPLAVIAVGLLIASSSPDAPHLTDTDPVRIGGSTSAGPGMPGDGQDSPPPSDEPAAGPNEDGPDTPQFQPDPPGANSGGSNAARPGSGPTTEVRPPVQRRPAPAPAPYDADDDDDDDEYDDDDDDDDDDD